MSAGFRLLNRKTSTSAAKRTAITMNASIVGTLRAALIVNGAALSAGVFRFDIRKACARVQKIGNLIWMQMGFYVDLSLDSNQIAVFFHGLRPRQSCRGIGKK